MLGGDFGLRGKTCKIGCGRVPLARVVYIVLGPGAVPGGAIIRNYICTSVFYMHSVVWFARCGTSIRLVVGVSDFEIAN